MLKLLNTQVTGDGQTMLTLRNTDKAPVSKATRDAWRSLPEVVEVKRGAKPHKVMVTAASELAATTSERERFLGTLRASIC